MATLHRRDFLNTAGAATAGLTVLASTGKAAANDRVGVAVVGVRGRGRGLAANFAGLKDVQVLYLCDVDSTFLPDRVNAVAKVQKSAPKTAKDIRDVLNDQAVDAIVV